MSGKHVHNIMTPQRRIIVNTLAQYVKTLANVVLSLWSTRIVLRMLGQEDYGVYTLVAGIVMLVSFATTAMSISTQRFLSVGRGMGDAEKQRRIFGGSLHLHALLAVATLVVMMLAGAVVFGFRLLNIPSGLQGAAAVLFAAASTMAAVSFLTAPFRALTIAHEDIVFSSFMDVVDGALKLGCAAMLVFIDSGRLIMYGIMIASTSLLQLLVFAWFCFRRYAEAGMPRRGDLGGGLSRRLLRFAGWTIYDTGCLLGRMQGMAIVLNFFLGPLANAAWGIAMQVHSGVLFISFALLNAIKPQLMQAWGRGDRCRMNDLAIKACRYSLLLLMPVILPMLWKLPEILDIWLGQYPPRTVLFTRIVLITALLNMLTYGLKPAVQATGRIRSYILLTATVKLCTLPVITVMLATGVALPLAMTAYPAIEFACALANLPLVKKATGMSMAAFWRPTLRYTLPPALLLTLAYILITPLQSGVWTAVAAALTVVYVVYVVWTDRHALRRLLSNKVVNESEIIPQ